jgi:hypothetical protein
LPAAGRSLLPFAAAPPAFLSFNTLIKNTQNVQFVQYLPYFWTICIVKWGILGNLRGKKGKTYNSSLFNQKV